MAVQAWRDLCKASPTGWRGSRLSRPLPLLAELPEEAVLVQAVPAASLNPFGKLPVHISAGSGCRRDTLGGAMSLVDEALRIAWCQNPTTVPNHQAPASSTNMAIWNVLGRRRRFERTACAPACCCWARHALSVTPSSSGRSLSAAGAGALAARWRWLARSAGRHGHPPLRIAPTRRSVSCHWPRSICGAVTSGRQRVSANALATPGGQHETDRQQQGRPGRHERCLADAGDDVVLVAGQAEPVPCRRGRHSCRPRRRSGRSRSGSKGNPTAGLRRSRPAKAGHLPVDRRIPAS